jgi:hypothetical protein
LDEFAKSPRLRLTVTLVLTVVIGVLSSVLASQIMPNGTLDWGLLPNVASFWILCLASLLWIFVHVRFLNYDESVLNFLDDDHCRAYIRKAKLEGIAAVIRSNPESAALVDAKQFLENLGVTTK